MYKFYISQKEDKLLDKVTGIDKLLVKLEHNAFTDSGRIASDYGVPTNIISYYESDDNKENIKRSFDNYERIVFDKIESIINK